MVTGTMITATPIPMTDTRALPGTPTTASLGLRSGSATGIEVALLGTDYDRMFEVARTFARAIEEELPHLGDPDISYRPTQPQLSVHLDRARARAAR